MRDFKVGDIITGREGQANQYTVTNKYAIMRVIKVGQVIKVGKAYNISVVIIKHKDRDVSKSNNVFTVQASSFKLYRGKDLASFKEDAPKLLKHIDLEPLKFEPYKGNNTHLSTIKYITNGDGQRQSSADFAVFFEGTKSSMLFTGQPCHGRLRNGIPSDSKPKFVVSAIYPSYHSLEPKVVKFFYRWMLKVSPYRHIILNKDVKDILENGIKMRTDVPSNYLLSALITSRYTWGQTVVVNMFYKINKTGVKRNKAFIFSHLFQTINTGEDGDVRYIRSTRRDETLSVNAAHVDEEFIKNFSESKMANPLTNFYDLPTYRDVFGVWSGDASEGSSYTPATVTSVLDNVDLDKVYDDSYTYRGWDSEEQRYVATIESTLRFFRRLTRGFK